MRNFLHCMPISHFIECLSFDFNYNLKKKKTIAMEKYINIY